jgi:ribonuclease P protein component
MNIEGMELWNGHINRRTENDSTTTDSDTDHPRGGVDKFWRVVALRKENDWLLPSKRPNKLTRHSQKSNKMIQSLLSSGKRFSSRHLNLYLDRANPPREIFNVAFLVSGKCGNAVERNRIKRWLREDFDFFQKKLNIPGRYAVTFKGNISEVNHTLIKDELAGLFESLNND